ncbi:piwi-like protein 1 [Pholidichthys leucotaenia]
MERAATAFRPFLEAPGEPLVPWTRWYAAFENYFIALDLGDHKKLRARASLVHNVGMEGQRILSMLGRGDSFNDVVRLMAGYFRAPENTIMRRIQFRQRRQQPDVQKITAGVQQASLEEKRGRGIRNIHDVGVNTRQKMAHVREKKTGQHGTPVSLMANFFRIVSRPQWLLFQYHVSFNPPLESRKLKAALLYQHDKMLGPVRVFDGVLLFLPLRLDKETAVLSETRSGEKFQITITLTNELPPDSENCLQFYNILFRRVLKMLNMTQVGRNFYNPNDPIDVEKHRLIIWPGYTTTILRYESSIMMCTDISHKLLRSETVLDLIRNLKQRVGHRFTEVCQRELVDIIVLTRYNNKTYRISAIAWDHHPDNTFRKGAVDVSFQTYYKTQYNLDISDETQPLLVTKLKKRLSGGGTTEEDVMLIPEFCFLTGLTDKMRSDNRIMRDLSNYTRLTAVQREGRLTSFMSIIHRNQDAQEELHKWGLNFDTRLLNLTGRVLPVESLAQRGTSYSYDAVKGNWSNHVSRQALISAPQLNRWLLFHTRQNFGEASTLQNTLAKVGLPMGFRVARARMVEFEEHTDSVLRLLQQHVDKDTQMVVVVLSRGTSDMYTSVKKALCVDMPIPSQCVTSSTLSRPRGLMSVITNIALQMVCKMGGELWSVPIPPKRIMVVGIDVFHSTGFQKRSVAALVANLNQNMSRWFSKCLMQRPGQELLDGLEKALMAALKEYYRLNHELPLTIVVYRDGVGDGQLLSVVNYEVAQIHNAIRAIGRDYTPRLGVVVVKKRINCRFFARGKNEVVNPAPGTVVDTEVTRPEWYDFYIVSQAVTTGSVSPTHYNVVYDTTGLLPDYMQRLTYKLCHMYYNWQGVIRVPAPCQYAHKLAYLVGDHIHEEPSTAMEDYLFYL